MTFDFNSDDPASYGIKDACPGMGTSFSLDPAPPPTQRQMSAEDIYREFVTLAKADPTYLDRLAAAFDYAKPFKRAEAAKPFPFHQIRAIECSISDRGPSKAKRERWDKCGLRYNAKIQVTTRAAQAISDPTWVGNTEFREPKRAVYDADRLHRHKTFSDAYRSFISEVVELAEARDQMIGFLRAVTDGDGSPFVPMAILLVDRQGLAAGKLDDAFLITKDATGTHLLRLPRFVTTTSKGKPLSGSFSMQSRGVRSGLTEKCDWLTGELSA